MNVRTRLKGRALCVCVCARMFDFHVNFGTGGTTHLSIRIFFFIFVPFFISLRWKNEMSTEDKESFRHRRWSTWLVLRHFVTNHFRSPFSFTLENSIMKIAVNSLLSLLDVGTGFCYWLLGRDLLEEEVKRIESLFVRGKWSFECLPPSLHRLD